MALKSTTVVVQGREVNITQMPARSAFKYKVKLVRLLGGSIGELLSVEDGKLQPAIRDPERLTAAIKSLCEKMDPDVFLGLILEGFRYTHVDGRHVGGEQEFDACFSDLSFMYRVYFETLKWNYGSFFDLGGIGSPEQKPGSGE